MKDVNWASYGLEDDDLVHRLKDWSPNYGENLEVVDLSSNQLSGRGVDALLKSLQTNGASVSKLKLHRNQLDDSVATALATYLRNQSQEQPLLEIHLSDNQITKEGGLEILHAAHACQCYPLSAQAAKKGGHSRRSLWLRLENNSIDDPGDMIYEASVRGGVGVHIERLIGYHNWDLRKALASAEEADVHMHFSILQNKREKGEGKGEAKGKSKGREVVEKGKGKGKEKSKEKGIDKGTSNNWNSYHNGWSEAAHSNNASHDSADYYQHPSASSNGGKANQNSTKKQTIWDHAVDSVRIALERYADVPDSDDFGLSSVDRGQAAIEAGTLSRAQSTMGGLLGPESTEILATHCASDVNLAFVFAELGIGNVEGAPTDIEGQAKAVREGAGQLAAKAEKQPAAKASLNALVDFACLLGFSEIRGGSSAPQFDDGPAGYPV